MRKGNITSLRNRERVYLSVKRQKRRFKAWKEGRREWPGEALTDEEMNMPMDAHRASASQLIKESLT